MQDTCRLRCGWSMARSGLRLSWSYINVVTAWLRPPIRRSIKITDWGVLNVLGSKPINVGKKCGICAGEWFLLWGYILQVVAKCHFPRRKRRDAELAKRLGNRDA